MGQLFEKEGIFTAGTQFEKMRLAGGFWVSTGKSLTGTSFSI